jgi:hypothetical protein
MPAAAQAAQEVHCMAAIKGNRSKRKVANRSKVKRTTAKRKRVLSKKRKHVARKSK